VGSAAEEFVDNDNFPHEHYVRDRAPRVHEFESFAERRRPDQEVPVITKKNPKRTRRSVRWVAAACAVVVLVGACSANDTKSSGTGDGGTFTEVVPTLVSLDPQGTAVQDKGTQTIARVVFDRLVTYEGSKITPQLATKWSVSSDGLTWTFQLDPKARFSDNSPVTATDVKASLQRTIDFKGVNATLFKDITALAAVDDHTFTITTGTPVAPLLYSLTLVYVAPAQGIGTPTFWTKPVGSGPYMVDSFAAGNKAVLVRNPDYWGTPSKLDRIVLTVIPEVSGRVTALRNGEVDVISEVSQDQAQSIQSGGLASFVTSKDTLAVLSIWFNNALKPFTDERVRQAMWYAVDWASITKSLYGQVASVAQAPVPSSVFGFAKQTPYSYDPAKAKSLLAQAGVATGFSTEIKYAPSAIPQIQSVLESAASDWAKVGIQVKLTPQDAAVWGADLLAVNWGMNAVQNTFQTGDSDQILRRLYISSAKRLGFADANYDKLVNDAASSSDTTRRESDYAQAEKILWDSAVGIWPLEFKTAYGVRSRVKGFTPSGAGTPDLRNVSVSK
jgi:peptide/nickel transport system substrate-binding protein